MVTLKYQERFKTLKSVFDEFTSRSLFELQSRGVFEEPLSPFKVGKESNIFLASKDSRKIIVKIYRVQNCDFKRMFAYIGQDPRYIGLKKKRREIIFAWAQREYKNLLRAEKAGINSPKALAFRNNIVVEEMIGEKEPAPALKDTYPQDTYRFFREIIKQIRKLYQEGLIHGDLSSFNILNFNEQPYFIDFSQATLVRTPNSKELLERDMKNIVEFFGKLGVKTSVKKELRRVIT